MRSQHHPFYICEASAYVQVGEPDRNGVVGTEGETVQIIAAEHISRLRIILQATG